MKKIYYTLIALVFTTVTLAQGIAVQGIARDNSKAALPQKELNFTFDIINTDGSEVRYTETEPITTDNFGVFSHIVGAGTRLNNVDFSEQGLRIRVLINYTTVIEVYNEAFNYTPYAYYAANGAPTGSIMPYVGTTAPEGWLMCDGSNIPSGNKYNALRALMSTLPNAGKTPNLRGRFLKGAGTGGAHNALITSQYDETTLGQYQAQSMQNHRHSDGDLTTSSVGNHRHGILRNGVRGTNGSADLNVTVTRNTNDQYVGQTSYAEVDGKIVAVANPNEVFRTGSAGSHNHSITGNTGNAIKTSSAASTQPLFLGTEETKPNNFSVNYIIKL